MIKKSGIICYLGIGSNLQNPHQQVARALQAISAHPGILLQRQSPWYASKAIGLDHKPDSRQPDYINGVIEIETTLTALDLLAALQKIETAQGRTRDVRWGARTLDIDILLYGDQHIDSTALQIPHPRILERNFVLIPLADLNPQLPLSLFCRAPVHSPKTTKNETISSLASTLSRNGLQLINTASIHES